MSNGAGIVGVGGSYQYLVSKSFSQKYAGYFIGDVHVEGLLSATSTSFTSDYRNKQNIVELGKETSANLFKLNPIEYNLKQKYTEYQDSTGNTVKLEIFDEKSQLFQKKHYGLIAQELQQIYPDLVYEDGDGYLSVDYVGIIPLLIQTIKELNARVEVLEKKSEQDNSVSQSAEILKK